MREVPWNRFPAHSPLLVRMSAVLDELQEGCCRIHAAMLGRHTDPGLDSGRWFWAPGTADLRHNADGHHATGPGITRQALSACSAQGRRGTNPCLNVATVCAPSSGAYPAISTGWRHMVTLITWQGSHAPRHGDVMSRGSAVPARCHPLVRARMPLSSRRSFFTQARRTSYATHTGGSLSAAKLDDDGFRLRGVGQECDRE